MKPILITLANEGMIRLTDNLLLNIRKAGMDNKLCIICTDKNTSNHYKDKEGVFVISRYQQVSRHNLFLGFLSHMVPRVTKRFRRRYSEYGTRFFRNITMMKYPGIKEVLEETGKDAIFIDGDIGIWRDLNPYFKNVNKLPEDILCSSEPNKKFCTGFTYFKNCKSTLDFINKHIALTKEKSKSRYYFDDQIIFNIIYDSKSCQASVKLLPESQFCNGHYLMTKGRWTQTGNVEEGIARKDMYTAHANWIKGIDNKISFLKKLGLYLLEY
jgi:hypothetical protein